MAVLMGIAAGMAFAAFVTAFLAWTSTGNQIRVLSERVKDYLLITPTSPGVKGAVTAQLFEAMKDVCETAKAEADAHKEHTSAQNNKTSLVSDVELLWRVWRKATQDSEAAVERLRKIEGSYQIAKR